MSSIFLCKRNARLTEGRVFSRSAVPQLHPVIRDECKEKRCVQLAKHFEHCQEKVQGGEGFKGEDCVEELCVYYLYLYRDYFD